MGKEKTIKKLMIFMLVLGMASMAWAIPYFQVAAVDERDHFTPSDVITIELRDNNPVSVAGFMIDWITDTDGAVALGTASEPQLFHSSFASTWPGILNSNGMLVEYLSAALGDAPPNKVLYTFEYHIPCVCPSTIIEIQTKWDGVNWWIPWFDYTDGSHYEGAVIPVLIHMVPEPTTIALLGLGGLALLRKHRK
jgi:hypothetical protein